MLRVAGPATAAGAGASAVRRESLAARGQEPEVLPVPVISFEAAKTRNTRRPAGGVPSQSRHWGLLFKWGHAGARSPATGYGIWPEATATPARTPAAASADDVGRPPQFPGAAHAPNGVGGPATPGLHRKTRKSPDLGKSCALQQETKCTSSCSLKHRSRCAAVKQCCQLFGELKMTSRWLKLDPQLSAGSFQYLGIV